MAKLSIDEAKLKLEPIQKAIETLQAAGVPIPENLTTEYERLMKAITGNASENVCGILNEKIAAKINTNAEFVELLAKTIGTRAKIALVVVVGEDGVKSVKFEAGGNSGGQKAGTSTGGGTKAPSKFNNYKVTVIGELPEYAEKENSFESAAKAVEFILNGGKNPLNKDAAFGKGNSMVRVLEGMQKEEAFTKNFSLECSYVQREKTPTVTEQTSDTPTAPAE